MKKRPIYVRGRISRTEKPFSHVLFTVGNVATEDKRMNRLAIQLGERRRQGHVVSGDRFMLIPSRMGMSRYALLDINSPPAIRGNIVYMRFLLRSPKYRGWWELRTVRVESI